MKKVYLFGMLTILLVTGCSCSKKEKENSSNADDAIIKDTKMEKLDVIDFVILYENNISNINYEVVNNTNDTITIDKMVCNLYDKDSKKLFTLKKQLGTIEPNNSINIRTNVTADLSSTKKVECSKE